MIRSQKIPIESIQKFIHLTEPGDDVYIEVFTESVMLVSGDRDQGNRCSLSFGELVEELDGKQLDWDQVTLEVRRKFDAKTKTVQAPAESTPPEDVGVDPS